jgi:L-alanine-DL-glutamate epimerase-like enolase superfamily enzyme
VPWQWGRTHQPVRFPENGGGRRDDFVQPSIVKIGGISHLWAIAIEAEKAGVTCVPHAFFFGPGYLATLHCLACKERDAPLERLFADVAFVAYSKTVPDANGAVEVPDRPGLGADPEEDMIAKPHLN